MAPAPAGTKLFDLDFLKTTVERLLKLEQVESARFFADKLVTLTHGNTDAIYMLARCYYLGGEYGRVLHLLRRHKLLDKPMLENGQLKFLHLATLCQFKTKKYEDGLQLLGDSDAEAESWVSSPIQEDCGGISISSCICLTRGLIYEALENRARSMKWYKLAVWYDVRNIEAFDIIISRQLLTTAQQRNFVKALKFPKKMAWLRWIYEGKLDNSNAAFVESSPEETESTSGAMDQDQDTESTTASLESRWSIKLAENDDILATKANMLYYKNKFNKCYDITKLIVEKDPFHSGILACHFCTLVELKKKAELYLKAHQLVNEYPRRAISWFGVGCYYYLTGNYDCARRFFSKATKLDSNHIPSWIGFGHSFTCQDASDQAIAAYRTANRLFPGSHIPLLCIGMEYLRTFSYPNAESFFKRARSACSLDPLVFNEVGSLAFKRDEYADAVKYFRRCIELCKEKGMLPWESSVYNLGHSYRRLQKYDLALEMYTQCLGFCGNLAHTVYSAIGLTHHFMGNHELAVENYHKALSLEPRDTLTTDMCRRVMKSMVPKVGEFKVPLLPSRTSMSH